MIDVGESDQIRTHVENHDREDEWKTNCVATIRYAVLYTPNMHRVQRQRIEQKIREEYQPTLGQQ